MEKKKPLIKASFKTENCTKSEEKRLEKASVKKKTESFKLKL